MDHSLPSHEIGLIRPTECCVLCNAPRTETYTYVPEEIMIGGRHYWKQDDHVKTVSCIVYLTALIGELQNEIALLKYGYSIRTFTSAG
jgi:hypothetical protein